MTPPHGPRQHPVVLPFTLAAAFDGGRAAFDWGRAALDRGRTAALLTREGRGVTRMLWRAESSGPSTIASCTTCRGEREKGREGQEEKGVG